MKNFHSWWLNQIKNKVGANFVGYETENGVTRLKIVIGKEAKYISLTGDFSNVTIETYAELLKQLE